MAIKVENTTIETIIVKVGSVETEMLQVYNGIPHSASNLLHCKHNYTGAYTRPNTTQHQRNCGRDYCSSKSLATNCTYTQSASNCTATVNCNVCSGNAKQLNTSHNYTGAYSRPNTTQHQRQCSRCTSYNTAANCTYTWNTTNCQTNVNCNVCGGNAKNRAHGTYSWVSGQTNCTASTATKCNQCAHTKQLAASHSYTGAYSRPNTTQHQRKCGNHANCTSYNTAANCTYTQSASNCTASVSCNVCGGNSKQLNTSHNYVRQTNPTCTAAGSDKCSRCTTTQSVAALGHNLYWNQNYYVISHRRECRNCDFTDNLGLHSYTYSGTNPGGNCSGTGSVENQTGFCSVCGKNTTRTVNRYDHNFVTQSGCTMTKICSRQGCGATSL